MNIWSYLNISSYSLSLIFYYLFAFCFCDNFFQWYSPRSCYHRDALNTLSKHFEHPIKMAFNLFHCFSQKVVNLVLAIPQKSQLIFKMKTHLTLFREIPGEVALQSYALKISPHISRKIKSCIFSLHSLVYTTHYPWVIAANEGKIITEKRRLLLYAKECKHKHKQKKTLHLFQL